MPQFRDVPLPPNPVSVRLQLGNDDAAVLRVAAAREGISLAALCRLALHLLAKGGSPDMAAVLVEAKRVIAEAQGPASEPLSKKPRGRPRKATSGTEMSRESSTSRDAPKGPAEGKGKKRKGK